MLKEDTREARGFTQYWVLQLARKGITVRILRVYVTIACLCCLFASKVMLSAPAMDQNQLQAHYQQAVRDLQTHRLISAEREFRTILQIDPHNGKAYGGLGMIAYQTRDYRNAAASFRTAVRFDPALWNVRAFLGMCEMQLGEIDKAEPILRESLPHITVQKVRDQAATDLMQIYYNGGKLNKAADILGSLQKAYPDDPEILYDAYRIHTAIAARALSTLSKVAPHSARLLEILGQALLSEGNTVGAISEYHKALLIAPQLPGLHFELGQAILTRSHSAASLAKARKEFERELSIDPANAFAEYELGEILWWESNQKDALRYFQRAVKLNTQFVKAQFMLGEALMSEGKPREALRHLLQAAKLDPANAPVHYQLATIYNKLGQTQDASRQFSIFRKLRREQNSLSTIKNGTDAGPHSGKPNGP